MCRRTVTRTGGGLDVERGTFKMGLCIYSDPAAVEDPERYAILPSLQQEKKWSWEMFRKIDVSRDVLALIAIVEQVLKSDKDITVVTRHDDYPFE